MVLPNKGLKQQSANQHKLSRQKDTTDEAMDGMLSMEPILNLILLYAVLLYYLLASSRLELLMNK